MDKKTAIIMLILAILLVAIPVTVQLAKTYLQTKSKASGEAFNFVTSDTLKCAGSGITQKCTTTTADVELQLDSPFGATPSASQ